VAIAARSALVVSSSAGAGPGRERLRNLIAMSSVPPC
jgi:hypothetical protein